LLCIKPLLDFYSAISLKHRSVGRHVAPLVHIKQTQESLLLLINVVFSREAANTNFIVFSLILPRLEPTIRGEHANHYANNTACIISNLFLIRTYLQTINHVRKR